VKLAISYNGKFAGEEKIVYTTGDGYGEYEGYINDPCSHCPLIS